MLYVGFQLRKPQILIIKIVFQNSHYITTSVKIINKFLDGHKTILIIINMKIQQILLCVCYLIDLLQCKQCIFVLGVVLLHSYEII